MEIQENTCDLNLMKTELDYLEARKVRTREETSKAMERLTALKTKINITALEISSSQQRSNGILYDRSKVTHVNENHDPQLNYENHESESLTSVRDQQKNSVIKPKLQTVENHPEADWASLQAQVAELKTTNEQYTRSTQSYEQQISRLKSEISRQTDLYRKTELELTATKDTLTELQIRSRCAEAQHADELAKLHDILFFEKTSKHDDKQADTATLLVQLEGVRSTLRVVTDRYEELRRDAQTVADDKRALEATKAYLGRQFAHFEADLVLQLGGGHIVVDAVALPQHKNRVFGKFSTCINNDLGADTGQEVGDGSTANLRLQAPPELIEDEGEGEGETENWKDCQYLVTVSPKPGVDAMDSYCSVERAGGNFSGSGSGSGADAASVQATITGLGLDFDRLRVIVVTLRELFFKEHPALAKKSAPLSRKSWLFC